MGINYSALTPTNEDAERQKLNQLAFGPAVSSMAVVALIQALSAPDQPRPSVSPFAASAIKPKGDNLTVVEGLHGPRFRVNGVKPMPIVYDLTF